MRAPKTFLLAIACRSVASLNSGGQIFPRSTASGNSSVFPASLALNYSTPACDTCMQCNSSIIEGISQFHDECIFEGEEGDKISAFRDAANSSSFADTTTNSSMVKEALWTILGPTCSLTGCASAISGVSNTITAGCARFQTLSNIYYRLADYLLFPEANPLCAIFNPSSDSYAITPINADLRCASEFYVMLRQYEAVKLADPSNIERQALILCNSCFKSVWEGETDLVMAHLIIGTGEVFPYANESTYVPEFPTDGEIKQVCATFPDFFLTSATAKLAVSMFLLVAVTFL